MSEGEREAETEDEYELMPSPVWAGLSAFFLHFGYNRWANPRILTQAALLSQEELHEPKQTNHDSAFHLLLHTLDTEWGWRIVCQERVKTPFLWEVEQIPDLDTLVRFWQEEAQRMDSYLHGLTDADLSQEIDYGMLLGDPPRSVVATVLSLLSHILYHSNNHRSELAAYLTHCGHSPGDLEFLTYLEAAGA